jgi:hypothetical protein
VGVATSQPVSRRQSFLRAKLQLRQRVKRSDAPAIQLFHKDEIIFKIHDARDTMLKMKWDHPEWKKDIKGVPFQVTANCTLDWECWIATRCKNNANCDGSGWTTTSEKRPRPSAQDARL